MEFTYSKLIYSAYLIMMINHFLRSRHGGCNNISSQNVTIWTQIWLTQTDYHSSLMEKFKKKFCRVKAADTGGQKAFGHASPNPIPCKRTEVLNIFGSRFYRRICG